MMRFLIFMAILGITGCAQLSPETKIEEGIWQSINAVDAAQTVLAVGAQPRCFQENGELGINGKHPGDAQIVAFNAVLGLVHYGVTWVLSGRGGEDYPAIRPWVLRLWEGFSIGYTGNIVHGNYQQSGDRLFVRDPAC
jgi:hypothetical protein